LRLALLLLLLLGPGCRLVFEREREGLRGSVWQATHLVQGQSTLPEALAQLGSPDLILKVGDGTRIYYAYWEADFFRFISRGVVPIGGGVRTVDLLNIALGQETLELARLDFDKNGVLALPPQVGLIPLNASGYYIAVDSNLVGFLEDRKRALLLRDAEEDEDDDNEEPEKDEADLPH